MAVRKGRQRPGFTAFDPPPRRRHDVQVLSRFHMLKQKLTVSRKQCLVSCLADGSAKLTSVGRGATLWRERDGPWCSARVESTRPVRPKPGQP